MPKTSLLHPHLCSGKEVTWLGFLPPWVMSQRQVLCTQYKSTSVHVLSQLPPAYVLECRTQSLDKVEIKALIVRVSLQSEMLFCPKEVQSFYQVSQDVSVVVQDS